MLVAILFLLVSIIGIIIFIPPFHWLTVLFLIVLISLTTFFTLKLTIKTIKYSILGSLLIFIILSLLSLNLFDPVNAVLSLSLFVGILILLK